MSIQVDQFGNPIPTDLTVAIRQPNETAETKESFVNQTPALKIAVHGISDLINTRLSKEALELCMQLIENGVHPQTLAEIVLHVIDAKIKKHEKEHGPLLP